MSRSFSALLVAVSCLLPAAALSAVVVERVDYHGWPGAWRMTNGTVDLVFVPQIGRIMRYGRAGGPNLLWENRDLVGKLPNRSATEWQNYGGDKLWPAPQSRWGWPPDRDVDPGAHTVESLPDGRLRITGKSASKHGIRFIREISLTSSGTEAIIANSVENTSGSGVDWSVWEVAQADDPKWAEIPLDRKEGLNYFDDPSVCDRGLSIKGSIPRGGASVRLARHPARSGKIGTDAARQWARARIGDDVFTILGTGSARGDYPDNGCRQEIYSNADPARYMEMELLGPIVRLRPGERTMFTTRWQIEPAKGD